MFGTEIPHGPAALFADDGSVLPGRPVLMFGASRGEALPCTLGQELERRRLPYRVLPVAAPGVLVLFEPARAVVGLEGILRSLRGADDRADRLPSPP